MMDFRLLSELYSHLLPTKQDMTLNLYYISVSYRSYILTYLRYVLGICKIYGVKISVSYRSYILTY